MVVVFDPAVVWCGAVDDGDASTTRGGGEGLLSYEPTGQAAALKSSRQNGAIKNTKQVDDVGDVVVVDDV